MPEETGTTTYEPVRVPVWRPLLFAGGGVALVGFTLALVWAFVVADGAKWSTPSPEAFPAPRLDAAPAVTLDRLMTDQKQRLAGYRWVNRGTGVVAIPIKRAMAIEAARGVDGYAPVVPPGDRGNSP